MDTDGDSAVTEPKRGRVDVDEALMRADATVRRLLRIASRYEGDDELDAAAKMTAALQTLDGADRLVEWLGVLAIWAYRNLEPVHVHPVAAAALEAMHAVQARKTSKAEEIVVRALAEHPGTVGIMVSAWARAFDRHATGGRSGRIDADIAIGGITTGGVLLPAAELSDGQRWSLAVCKAYMAGDAEGFTALVDQLYEGDDARTLLPALVATVVSTNERFPRGWAWDDDEKVCGMAVPDNG